MKEEWEGIRDPVLENRASLREATEMEDASLTQLVQAVVYCMF